jgi:hypothetical protein
MVTVEGVLSCDPEPLGLQTPMWYLKLCCDVTCHCCAPLGSPCSKPWFLLLAAHWNHLGIKKNLVILVTSRESHLKVLRLELGSQEGPQRLAAQPRHAVSMQPSGHDFASCVSSRVETVP